MKQLNVTLEDDFHKKLINKKNGLTWVQFLELLLELPDKKIKEYKKEN